MSGKDITEYVRVQSICSGNGIVLENKLKENEKKKTEKTDSNVAFEDTFLHTFMKVHSARNNFSEKTAK